MNIALRVKRRSRKPSNTLRGSDFAALEAAVQTIAGHNYYFAGKIKAVTIDASLYSFRHKNIIGYRERKRLKTVGYFQI
jgi:hypothetical protein